eukprot:6186592-Pleurochrysis_carterae.AAC.1
MFAGCMAFLHCAEENGEVVTAVTAKLRVQLKTGRGRDQLIKSRRRRSINEQRRTQATVVGRAVTPLLPRISCKSGWLK